MTPNRFAGHNSGGQVAKGLSFLAPWAVFASLTRFRSRDRCDICYLGDGVLHDEDVRHAAELTEVLPQPVLVSLPAQAAHKQLAGGGVGAGGAAPAGLALQHTSVGKYFVSC